jgi:Phage integrase family
MARRFMFPCASGLPLPVCAVAPRQLTKPFQVRLFGKGRKERYCPLWAQTAAVLRAFCRERNLDHLDLRSEARVFLNQRGEPLTRFGIRYILAQCLSRAFQIAPHLRKKRLHPHSMRHSTAIALIEVRSGSVDHQPLSGSCQPQYDEPLRESRSGALVRAGRTIPNIPRCRDHYAFTWPIEVRVLPVHPNRFPC